jgi:uncharacterized protein
MSGETRGDAANEPGTAAGDAAGHPARRAPARAPAQVERVPEDAVARAPEPAADDWVSSPCTGLCILHASVCTGCGRTLDEITHWTAMTSAQRHAVLHAVAARQTRRSGAS